MSVEKTNEEAYREGYEKGLKEGKEGRVSIWQNFILYSALGIIASLTYLFSTQFKGNFQGQKPQTIKLSEMIREIKAGYHNHLLIRDSTTLKAIALDSLNFINQIEQPASAIEVNKSEFLERLQTLQTMKLQEFQDAPDFNGMKGKINFRITSKSFVPLRFLTGSKDLPLTESEKVFLASHYINPDKFPFLSFGGVKLNPKERKMDIRRFGVSSTCINQNNDGTCWAIAATKAFDISYQIVHKSSIISSQQQAIDCSGAGDKSGGLSYKVFQWMEDKNVSLCDSSVYPYNGAIQTCRSDIPKSYNLTNWSLLSRNTGLPATMESIKDAICRFGCVVSSVKTTLGWRDYGSNDVFIDRSTPRKPDNSLWTDHSIMIIGWDDDKQAWLIKNSWGDDWGNTGGNGTECGYMWLDYKSSNIGLMAAWVVAR